MTDSSYYRVETTSRLAQWKIENFASCTFRKSDPFKIGKWNWHLAVEKNRTLTVKLFPEFSNITRDNPPVASFIIRAISTVRDRKVLVHPEVVDKKLKHSEDFVWVIEDPLPGKFIIDLEFLDLKTGSPSVPSNFIFLNFTIFFTDLYAEFSDHQLLQDGGKLCSIWAEGFTKKEEANATALASLSKMFTESIHTDIVIKTLDGSIGTHRAVLAARSPVFRSMFSHDLKEKEQSTIEICDMSIEACKAFLAYIYGSIQTEEFLTHRLALLRASDKYDIFDLKEACHDSLIEDIDTKNVLERLQNATLYHLPKLKNSCLKYLVQFGKIFDMQDEFQSFLQGADRELIAEIFHEVLAAWNGF